MAQLYSNRSFASTPARVKEKGVVGIGAPSAAPAFSLAWGVWRRAARKGQGRPSYRESEGGGPGAGFLTGEPNPFTFVPLWFVYGEGTKVATRIGRRRLVRVHGPVRFAGPHLPGASGDGP